MADKEVLEGNKAIRLFMIKGTVRDEEYEMRSIKHLDHFNALDYHKDWDALMPVVEKIYSLQKGKWHDKTRGFATDIWLSFQEKIDIQTTWNEVIKFITWYNSITKPINNE